MRSCVRNCLGKIARFVCSLQSLRHPERRFNEPCEGNRSRTRKAGGARAPGSPHGGARFMRSPEVVDNHPYGFMEGDHHLYLCTMHNFGGKFSSHCPIDKCEFFVYNICIKHSFKYGSAPRWDTTFFGGFYEKVYSYCARSTYAHHGYSLLCFRSYQLD